MFLETCSNPATHLCVSMTWYMEGLVKRGLSSSLCPHRRQHSMSTNTSRRNFLWYATASLAAFTTACGKASSNCRISLKNKTSHLELNFTKLLLIVAFITIQSTSNALKRMKLKKDSEPRKYTTETIPH